MNFNFDNIETIKGKIINPISNYYNSYEYVVINRTQIICAILLRYSIPIELIYIIDKYCEDISSFEYNCYIVFISKKKESMPRLSLEQMK
jgi:hypothetical protein